MIHVSAFSKTAASLGTEKALRFTIDQRFPSLNEVIASAKMTGRGYAYSQLKRTYTELVANSIVKPPAIPFSCVYIIITWHEKTRRRDPDNVAFAVKFILDGMVNAGVIKNDSPKEITGWNNKFVYGVEDKVEVTVYGM